ncbi:hypothetical protein [Romboutsia sp.]|uniref:hypothetical protein n=1 Tax=Romboutsia sp. TaxID=1965302 RepID=UPI003F2DBD42
MAATISGIVFNDLNSSGNTNLSGNNFGHDNITPWGCIGYALQSSDNSIYNIDLVSGQESLIGSTVALNSLGYNVLTGNINMGWGGIFRLVPNLSVLDFNVANLPLNILLAGDVSP